MFVHGSLHAAGLLRRAHDTSLLHGSLHAAGSIHISVLAHLPSRSRSQEVFDHKTMDLFLMDKEPKIAGNIRSQTTDMDEQQMLKQLGV